MKNYKQQHLELNSMEKLWLFIFQKIILQLRRFIYLIKFFIKILFFSLAQIQDEDED